MALCTMRAMLNMNKEKRRMKFRRLSISALWNNLQSPPGDRVGNGNGTSRLRTQYVERLARHDREVAEARARLDSALQDLREAR